MSHLGYVSAGLLLWLESSEEIRGPMITLTERAATEVKRVMEKQELNEGTFLRLGVSGGGCSGFSYELGFDTDAGEDITSDQHGIRVVVDRKSSLYLDGMTVDFYDDLDKRGFTFNNPNATKSCGCGSSFQV